MNWDTVQSSVPLRLRLPCTIFSPQSCVRASVLSSCTVKIGISFKACGKQRHTSAWDQHHQRTPWLRAADSSSNCNVRKEFRASPFEVGGLEFGCIFLFLRTLILALSSYCAAPLVQMMMSGDTPTVVSFILLGVKDQRKWARFVFENKQRARWLAIACDWVRCMGVAQKGKRGA